MSKYDFYLLPRKPLGAGRSDVELHPVSSQPASFHGYLYHLRTSLHYLFPPEDLSAATVITPLFYRGGNQLRGVKQLAQDHTASKKCDRYSAGAKLGIPVSILYLCLL
jgi:hypothetical protein